MGSVIYSMINTVKRKFSFITETVSCDTLFNAAGTTSDVILHPRCRCY